MGNNKNQIYIKNIYQRYNLKVYIIGKNNTITKKNHNI